MHYNTGSYIIISLFLTFIKKNSKIKCNSKKAGEDMETRSSGYKTRQRDLILNILEDFGNNHFTVEEITEILSEKSTSVGKTTVYRYLEKLAQEGVVKKYTVDGERSVCYQYLHSHKTCSNHYHLKCEKCGKLIHMECDTIDKLAEHVFEHHNFRLNGTKCVFYGICENCHKGENL